MCLARCMDVLSQHAFLALVSPAHSMPLQHCTRTHNTVHAR